jgi:hypothetical protein
MLEEHDAAWTYLGLFVGARPRWFCGRSIRIVYVLELERCTKLGYDQCSLEIKKIA